MAKLNNVRVGIQYGYMDDNWNWIPLNPPIRKENTMKVTQAIKNALSITAQDDLNKAIAAVDAAKKVYDEAYATRNWVDSLTVGSDLQSPVVNNNAVVFKAPVFTKTARTRYFVASKSGLTKGHYITRFSDNTVDCNCPGFVNRGYCWASNKVKASQYAFSQWNLSKSLFESNRIATFNQNA